MPKLDDCRFVGVCESMFVVYAVLPNKGEGLTVDEIYNTLKDFNINLYEPFSFTPMRVEKDLWRLEKEGLVEVVKTPDGEPRYRRKFHKFKIPIKVCEFCGSPFLARNMKRKFCSQSCRVRHHQKHCAKCREKVRERFERFLSTKSHSR